MKPILRRRAAVEAGQAQTDEDGEKPKKSVVQQGVELAFIVAIAFGLALLIQAFLIKPYRIPSGSMEPTLKVGQRVLADRILNNFKDPHVGEIIIFHPPEAAETGDALGPNGQCGVANGNNTPCPKAVAKESSATYIKRVVGGPGDRIRIDQHGHVYRNGVRESDAYIAPCQDGQDCGYENTITVPAGHWYMMGDNRGNSDDSRYWGPVPKKWIIGQAFFTYWPVNRIGFL